MSVLEKIWEHFAADKASLAEKGIPADARVPGKLLADSSAEGPYTDLPAIRQRIHDHIDEAARVRWSFERNWFRPILYYLGNQWISWDTRSSRFREKRLVRKWIPRPVTNRFASTIDSIAGALQTFAVRPSIWPATLDTDDLATAEVADRLVAVLDEEVDMAQVREDLAAWMSLNADAWLFPYYDHADASLGTTLIAHYRCPICQYVGPPQSFEREACPSCGIAGQSEAAVDERGQPIGETVPIGRLRVDVCSPLEVYVNQNIRRAKELHRFTRLKMVPLDYVRRTWPETGQYVQADQGAAVKTGQYFVQALAHIAEDGGYFSTRGYADHVTLFTHVELPSADFPEGLAVTMASDDTVLEVGPSPFVEVIRGQPAHYLPLIQATYRRVPGRLYGKTPAYDLWPKQDQLNRLESLIEMAVMKGVYVSWLLPTGSSIVNLKGDPGQIVKWTPQGTTGAKPEVVTAPPIPPIVLEWKKQLEVDFEELAGTYDAMKGTVPQGVSAGYAIQLLTERSYGRFGPVFANMERAYMQLYELLLKLARQYMTEPRLRRIRGASGQWQIDRFLGAELKGAIDVKIEGGQAKPRSKVAEQALVESLTAWGYLQSTDPAQRLSVLENFGMAHLLSGADEDKRQAAREWDLFVVWDAARAPVDPQTGAKTGGPFVKVTVDNHILHVLDHQHRAKTDQFEALDRERQLIWQRHIQDHMQALQPAAPQPGEAGSGLPPAAKGPHAPAGSKAAEVSDPSMALTRRGGNVTLGGKGV